MKRLLYILLASMLFASCSSDDDKDDDIIYIDNKIIEGKWYWIQATDSVVLEFKNNTAKDETWDKYLIILQNTHNYGDYKMTSERLYLGQSKTGREYKLKGNTFSFPWDGVNVIDFTKIEE